MADDISKTVVGVLLVLTIIVSVVGTLVVLSSVEEATTISIDKGTSTAQAKLTVEKPPVTATSSGEVKIQIEGGEV